MQLHTNNTRLNPCQTQILPCSINMQELNKHCAVLYSNQLKSQNRSPFKTVVMLPYLFTLYNAHSPTGSTMKLLRSTVRVKMLEEKVKLSNAVMSSWTTLMSAAGCTFTSISQLKLDENQKNVSVSCVNVSSAGFNCSFQEVSNELFCEVNELLGGFYLISPCITAGV